MKNNKRKLMRTIDVALKGIFSGKSFIKFSDPKEMLRVDNFLRRELSLPDHVVVCLNDAGLDQLDRIFDAATELDLFNGLANYSDVAGSCRKVIERMIHERKAPNSTEFLELVEELVSAKIDTHTFVVPVYGIQLDGIDQVQLGTYVLTKNPPDHIKRQEVSVSAGEIDEAVNIMRGCDWLIGSAQGTWNVALERFKIQAELVGGGLIISAASMYSCGASGFRIGVVMSPEQGNGQNRWMHWRERRLQLGVSVKFFSNQAFLIDLPTLGRLRDDNGFDKMFAMLESDSQSPLESAIAKAVYWFADAHRESVPTMHLVKYWSCIETFFSAGSKTNITSSVSAGVATILTTGGYAFVELDKYVTLKKRVAHLYSLRSRAVHQGSYAHVSSKDVAELSGWTAWMLINMVALVERGYTTPEQVKVQVDRLDAMLSGVESIINPGSGS